ncbi:MAG: hypothetical protein CFE23_12960 [Flavobacterium sp. BFFFF1]|uniref:sensor histidine kinase n=1 Tax=Flavobacterium sp. BFFFF1 TaxID=2015557 RepID=UPI000BD8CD58|nr:PAS domain-containing sensor histidine kinase [Flavobacterium sp. BFFFF1]OYU79702.1 MAG: hypothetical protein CFE23_12960 [Flavobacterium sp. BFFFF1]
MFSNNKNLLASKGGVATAMEEMDWSSSTMGSVDHWPVSLRSALGIMLSSKFPMLLFWGKDIHCFYNDACYQGMGITGNHTDLLGKTGTVVLPKTWNVMLPFVNEVLKNTEASWHQEQWLPIQRHGKTVDSYWTSSYSPVHNELGVFEGIIVTLNDVTEKVEVRKKMEEAEERSRLATEIAEIATWDLDLQTHEMIHSENLAHIFGYPKTAKLSNAMMMSHLHAEDLSNIAEKAFEVAMTTGIYKFESRIIKKSGESGWIRSHGKIFFNADDEPVKIIGTLIDITLEQNRREILMKSESKFRLLADSMPQLIWTADPAGDLNYYNRSLAEYTGASTLTKNTGGWPTILHRTEIKEYKNQWRRAITSGADFQIEHRLRKNDGTYRWHVTRAIAQKDSDGTIQMWVGTSTDIQQQKDFTGKLEQQVKERTAELENNNINLIKINIELQSFVYISSHDLQEPLRKIQIFISRLYGGANAKLPENTTLYLDKINESAIRMRALIQDLLAYSRTNLADNIFVKNDLRAMAEKVIDDYSELIQESGAVVEIFDSYELKVITFQFWQLLNNLLGNALKFTKPGVPPHIVFKAFRINGSGIDQPDADPALTYCHISIADNGIGFDMEYKDKIFEVFRRLHNNEVYTGTGIGLAIVKKIVQNHGGFITASSVLNQGTTFNIYIPEM